MANRCFRSRVIGTAIALTALAAPSRSTAEVIGQWEFEGSLSAAVGWPLQYLDGLAGATASATVFGSTEGLGIPGIGGEPAGVMRFPPSTAPAGYKLVFEAPPNGGGTLLNQWTLIVDLLYTGPGANGLRALIETDNRNLAADADLFIGSRGGLGVAGEFDGEIRSNTWHRIGMVVDTAANTMTKYIDGVAVGVQPVGDSASVDGRWALDGSGGVQLFNDDDGQVTTGHVNSLQLRSGALSPPEMRAYGGPQAAGIPLEVPPVPPQVVAWMPRGPLGTRDSGIGAILHGGSSQISDESLALRFDGQPLAIGSISRTNDAYGYPRITVESADPGSLAPGSLHTVDLDWFDPVTGSQTTNHSFVAALFVEDFEDLSLGPTVDEWLPGDRVWTKVPPAGWVRDDSGVPGLLDPAVGVTEWEGWAFAEKEWWIRVAGDQRRSLFTKGRGTVAVSDPDEWDDRGNPATTLGYFKALVRTPPIGLSGVGTNRLYLTFDSSWRPECCDDGARTNNQTARVWVAFDGGPDAPVLEWGSQPGSPSFHAAAENETVLIPIQPAEGAESVVLTFGLSDAADDWWWAVDHVVLHATPPPPVLASEPLSRVVSEGAPTTLSVVALPDVPTGYRWQRNGADLQGASGAGLTLPSVGPEEAGLYRVIVTNVAGAVTSRVARVEVGAPAITNDLVLHMKFDGLLADASGRQNHGVAVGAIGFVSGRIGFGALRYSTAADGSAFNYVTLGRRADLDFGDSTDFSVSFWARFNQWTGDPVFLGDKDWSSGATAGWVVATESDGRLQWNLAGDPGARKDFDSVGGAVGGGEWHYVAMTFDRDGDALTFIDGALAGVEDLGSSDNTLGTPPGLAFNIGQDGTGRYTFGGTAGIVDGTLDDLGIWRRLLSRQEISAIHAAGLQGKDLATVRVMTAPPRIEAIVLTNGNAVLRWTGEPGLSLERARAPTGAGGWFPVPNTAGSSGYTNLATGTAYFRLIRQ